MLKLRKSDSDSSPEVPADRTISEFVAEHQSELPPDPPEKEIPEEQQALSLARKPRPSLRREVALKRRPEARPVNERDWPALHVAYRKGALNPIILPIANSLGVFIPEDWPLAEFRQFMEGIMGLPDGKWWILSAMSQTYKDAPVAKNPVGMVSAVVHDGRRLEPYVVWFPWASARNRVEASVRWLQDNRRHWVVILTVPDSQAPLLRHMERYAVVRHVGVIPGFYTDDEAARIYRGL